MELPKGLISRLIGILIVSIPIGWIGFTWDISERQELASLAKEEILRRLEDARFDSRVEAIAAVAILGYLYYSAVELVAVVIRWAVRTIGGK